MSLNIPYLILLLLTPLTLSTITQLKLAHLAPLSITAFCLLPSHSHQDHVDLLVGRSNGSLQLIDLNSSTVIHRSSILTNKARKIFYRSGVVIAHDTSKAVHLNNTLGVIDEWRPNQQIKDITVAQDGAGLEYLSLIHSNNVQQRMFSQGESYVPLYSRIYDGFNIPVNLAQYSPTRSHLYVISQHQQLVIYDLSKQYQQKDSQRKGQIVLERKFNFYIESIIADHKDRHQADPDGLLVVTREGTVYYTNRGTIATFLPYGTQGATLITTTFCQHSHIVTLHQQQTRYLLTFFNKKTFLTQEVVDLGTAKEGIVGMDCNYGYVAVLTREKVIILKHQGEQARTNVHNWQMLMTGLILLVIICCCNQRKNKNEEGSEEEKESDKHSTESFLAKRHLQAPSTSKDRLIESTTRSFRHKKRKFH